MEWDHPDNFDFDSFVLQQEMEVGEQVRAASSVLRSSDVRGLILLPRDRPWERQGGRPIGGGGGGREAIQYRKFLA